MDLMGYPLSSVASAGDDAPPLPADSGSGRRIVYDRAGQRVWAVGEDGAIIRSWLVSGSKYSNEEPGTHEVYSRSEQSTAWNGKAWLPQMVRYQRTDIGHIGFHAIPLHVERRLAVPDRGRTRHPAVGWLPAAGATSTPRSCGTSPTSAPRSSSSDARSPPCLRCSSIGASQQKCNASHGWGRLLVDQRRAWRRTACSAALARISAASTRTGDTVAERRLAGDVDVDRPHTRRVGDVPRIHRCVRPPDRGRRAPPETTSTRAPTSPTRCRGWR